MSIDVDVSSARGVNAQMPPIIRTLETVRTNILRTRESIDPRVLTRSNLRSRLSKVQADVEFMEKDLKRLHKTVSDNLTNYEENEIRLRKRAERIPNEIK